MTSQINFNNINAAYPVAGQDNDSQGFRDNFSAIKVALSTATNEITTLQTNTAKLNEFNNFQGNAVSGAVLVNNTQYAIGESRVQDNELQYPVYVGSGDYQIFSVNTNTNFIADSWTAGTNYQKIRVQIIPRDPDEWTLTTSSQISINFLPNVIGGTVIPERPTTFPYVSKHAVSSVWDIWSHDGGLRQYVKFVGTYTWVDLV